MIPYFKNKNIPSIIPAPFTKDVSRQCFPFRVGDPTWKYLEWSHLVISSEGIYSKPFENWWKCKTFQGCSKPQGRSQRCPDGEGWDCWVAQVAAPLNLNIHQDKGNSGLFWRWYLWCLWCHWARRRPWLRRQTFLVLHHSPENRSLWAFHKLMRVWG